MLSQTHTAQRSRQVAVLVFALFFCVLWSSPVTAQHKHAHEQSAKDPRPGQMSQSPGRPGVIKVGADEVSIPDIEVLDQNGRKLHLYSDLVKGRVVVVSFFFTSCTFVCPLQGQALSKLQAALGEKLGKEVFFISITKDPRNDTPQRLSMWGKRFGVESGWTLVTGNETVMTQLLWTLIGEQPGPQLHNSVLLIGNDRTGIWEDAAGLSSPDKLIEIIDRVSRVEAVSNSGSR